MPIERKLAAIMFTDIAGYTALSAKDSTKASELLKTQRKLLKPIVEKHGGSWMKEMGDGLLLTFDSATSAVECSIAIQEATKGIDGLNLRIGIHEGEVIKQDGDVIGDDVNVASRIEPFSAEGGVAISQKVQQAISSNTTFTTQYIGQPKLKGVAQKVEVYCIISHGLPKTDISKVSAKLEKESKFNIFALTGGVLATLGIIFWVAVGILGISFGDDMEIPSVGILMMENLGKEDEEFWSRGMTADLITKVTGAGLIRVASLSDILKIDNDLSLEKKADNLGVKYILSHQFLLKKEGFDLWYTLEDTKSGIALFSKKTSEPMDMATQMVGNLANDIITSLKVETKLNIMEAPTNNVEAYEYYLRGKNKYTFRQNTDHKEIAVELINKAIDLDEDMLLAQIFLGKIYATEGRKKEALKIYNRVFDQAKNSGNKVASMQSLYRLGRFNESLNIAREINDKHFIGWNLNSLGYKALFVDSTNAHDIFKESFSIFKELGDKKGMGVVLQNIGTDYGMQDKSEDALKYYLRALKLFEEAKLLTNVRDVMHKISGTYFRMENIPISIEYINRARKLAVEIGDDIPNIMIFLDQAFSLVRFGYCDDAIDYGEEFKDHMDNVIKKLEDLEEFNQWIHLYNAYNIISWAYDCTGEYGKVINIINLMEEEENFSNDLDGWGWNQVYLLKGAAYYNLKKYSKSLDYFQKVVIDINTDSFNDFMKYEHILFKYNKLVYVYMLEKILNKNFNIQEASTKIKEIEALLSSDPHHKTEGLDFDRDFMIYKLLGDKYYLEKVYNDIMKKAKSLENKIQDRFLNYPIPKAIVEEWEKVK